MRGDRARDGAARELAEHLARGRRVKGDHTAAGPQRCVQRGDVGVAEQRLRHPRERVVVDVGEKTHRAIAAAQAPDPVDRTIAHGMSEVAKSRRIIAREVSGACEGMFGDDWFPAERVGVAHGALQLIIVAKWTGGCDERTRAPGDSGWASARRVS